MIITKKNDLVNYQRAGQLSTKILFQLKQAVKVGVLPIEIDRLAEELCAKNHVRPSFKGVNPRQNPYQYSTCISVNDVVVHGIPSKTEKINSGDIVKVDFGLVFEGLYTDHCFTLVMGKPKPQTKKLVTVARDAVAAAIPLAVSGNSVGDLGNAMGSLVKKNGFNVLKQYTGHGIGRTLWDPPAIPAFGQAKTGERLEKNMVLCLEAQVVAGSDRVVTADDGWSVRTMDGSMSAMFEYMVIVSDKQPFLLTDTLDWGMIG